MLYVSVRIVQANDNLKRNENYETSGERRKKKERTSCRKLMRTKRLNKINQSKLFVVAVFFLDTTTITTTNHILCIYTVYNCRKESVSVSLALTPKTSEFGTHEKKRRRRRRITKTTHIQSSGRFV